MKHTSKQKVRRGDTVTTNLTKKRQQNTVANHTRRHKTKSKTENKSPFINLSQLKTDDKLTAKALQYEYAFEYGVDLSNRIIQISNIIEYPLFDIVDAAMTELESINKKQPITIKINSIGGDVYEALAVVGRLLESPCKIITKGYGAIMSAATLILACGNERHVSRYAWYMYHEASYGDYGKHSVQKATVAQIDKEELQWARAMAEFSNQTEEFWLKTGVLIDAYFDATQLVDLGVADKVF